ncbi:MAG: MBL fold metallo-hydrolase, partial [Clostridia bacterium]|nr:MBL fold metallo-hydrolase [Clostridia bacterium]
MQLTKSVYLVSGANYDLLGNVYAIRGERGVALVDSGEPCAAETIESSLARWGMGGLPVTHLFLT